jgi:DNA-binding transcriptional LysR family regulator
LRVCKPWGAAGSMTQPFDQSNRSLNRNPLDDPRILSGPFWAELRVFLAVAKSKSFNRAAEELSISQPTVSRHVYRLQDLMGCQLLNSSNSGIVLTERGTELAKTLLELDDRLFKLSRHLRAESHAVEGLVHINATEALAGLFIVPNIADLNERFPNIRLHLKNPINLLKFRENQSDIAIRFAMPTEKGIEYRAVGFVHLIPVTTHSYLARYGMPTKNNLENHCFIDTDYYAARNDLWRSWREALDRGHAAHFCDNSYAYTFMIKSGLGIGLLGNYTISDPALVPLEIGVHIRLPLYLHADSERLNSKPARAVYDWLSELFSLNPWFGPILSLETFPTTSDALSQIYSGTPFASRDSG